MKRKCVFIILVLLLASTANAQVFGDILGTERMNSLIAQETRLFTDQFSGMTGKRIEISNSFQPTIAPMVLRVRLPTQQVAPELYFRDRYNSFLSDLTAFLLATQKPLVFGGKEVEQYLAAARKAGRCGRVPCTTGCPESCDEMCNRCPTK